MTHIVVLDPESVLSFTGTGTVVGVDISEYEDSAFISVALPEFPLTDVTLSSCYLDLTSNETGDFDIGPTDSLPFTGSVTPLVKGDSELRFPISLLTHVDRSEVTGVRFRIGAVNPCVFRALALRVVTADWVYAPLDTDTLYTQAKRPITRTGALYAPSEFPVAAGEWPIIFRATHPSSNADPRPIDASIGVFFRTGSLTAATGETDAARTFVEGNSISIPDAASLDFTGPFTLEAWVKPSDLDNGPLGVITKYNDVATKRGYRLGVSTTGELVFDWSNNGSTSKRAISSGGSVLENAWNHIVLTYTTTLLTFYVNGNAVGTASTGGAVAATDRPLKIGAWNTG